MNQSLIENGGVVFSFKAHALCAHCTEFADFQSSDYIDMRLFERHAIAHFQSLGWECPMGSSRVTPPDPPRTYCPTCKGDPKRRRVTSKKG
jgi:hypothetical protein